mgnify:CR=1 FL=1
MNIQHLWLIVIHMYIQKSHKQVQSITITNIITIKMTIKILQKHDCSRWLFTLTHLRRTLQGERSSHWDVRPASSKRKPTWLSWAYWDPEHKRWTTMVVSEKLNIWNVTDFHFAIQAFDRINLPSTSFACGAWGRLPPRRSPLRPRSRYLQQFRSTTWWLFNWLFSNIPN